AFARAAVSFHEHYGWDVGRTTLRNHTLAAAQEAETYIDRQLQAATKPYGPAPVASQGVGAVLLGRDGCEIRTGVYMTAAEAGVLDRGPRERVRVEHWRDVRTRLCPSLEGP